MPGWRRLLNSHLKSAGMSGAFSFAGSLCGLPPIYQKAASQDTIFQLYKTIVLHALISHSLSAKA
jgi:hypothetical protein